MNEKLLGLMLKMYDEKLQSLMTKEGYMEFVKQVAKETFAAEINDLEDGDLKQFCLDNFDIITGGEG